MVDKSSIHNGEPFLTGGGEMGTLIRSMDWARTSLGNPGRWPIALKQTISTMLSGMFPVLICWGSDYIQFYNDAFRPINGSTKHPQALGGSARDTYSEIWDTIGPMFDRVMHGESLGFPDFMVPLDRNGYPENCYFDFSYSPIRDEDGHIRGILVICIETTAKVNAIARQSISQENIRNTVKQAPVGMCIIRGRPPIVEEVNDTFLKLVGKKRSDFDHAPYWDVISETAPYYSPITDKILQTGETYRASEHRIALIREGREEIIYVDFVYQPMKEADGRINTIMIIATDVTDKVSARYTTEQNLTEYQALNEELTATNEELAAVNEELAVTNEELLTAQYDLYRKNTELVESESRLKMAIESTQLGTWDYDPVNRTMYWSDESRKIFGLSPDEVASFETFRKHVHPDDYNRVQTEIQTQLDNSIDGRYDVSYRIIRFDDQTTRWVRAQGGVKFDTQGQQVRHAGTLLDITQSKIAQEKVSRSEKLFKSIARNIPGSLIIVIDKDHRFVTIEGDIMERMGYDRKDYEGKHPTEVGPPERYEASKHLYERVLAGETFSEERKAEKGGNFMVHMVPLKNEENEVYAGLIIALDITDIKQAEEKSAKLVAIIESSDDAIVSKTLESVITSWNNSAERIFGYTAEEIIGQTIYKIIPEDRREEEPLILSRLKSGERVEHFETKRLRKDGRLIDVSVTVSPIKDSHGKIIGLSKIARDITEKKLDETRKNDFIGMVSHELKTPLTTLSALLQVLQIKLKNNEDIFVPTALDKANVHVKKMTGMINGFLNVSRLESGKIMIDYQEFNLGDLIEEVVKEVQLTVSTHIIKMQPWKPVTINADYDKIGSVLTNLINNAVKYSPKGEIVEVNLERVGNNALVSVRDEGIGIKAEDKAKLFERYYRVQNNQTRQISGFGIGLYLSSEIIHRHDGQIWMESEEGKGSTFFFSLPLIH